MNEIINKLNEVKNSGTTSFTARVMFEQRGLIKHLGYGKFELTEKGIMAIGVRG